MKKIFLFIIFLVGNTYHITAQMLSNQGVLISIKGNALIAIHGDVVNDNSGTFHNSNEIHCFGDWENNANNEAFVSLGQGIVHLQGNNQRIKGNSISRFYDLRLENTGIKYADIDVYVDGFLHLNDREFNVDTNTSHVFNSDLQAITHSQTTNWGFVSALGNGGLLRHTNLNAAYFYPVGSALSPARFRPINITPHTNTPSAYKVRMANIDATTEGWDRTRHSLKICEVNPLFFHRISQTQGNVAANIQFFYLANQDGLFQGIGQWQNTNLWSEATAATTTTNSNYNMDIIQSSIAIQNFSPNAFALTQASPETDLVADANPLCSNDSITLTASNLGTPFSHYDFYVDSILVQSSSSPNYTSQLLPVGDIPVWAVGSYANCGDVSDTILLDVWQGVDPQAFSDTIIIQGTSANLLATGGYYYNWLPSASLVCSGCSSTVANPTKTTKYLVEIESIDGCIDTASVRVVVLPNIHQALFIPNVITPNNDGFNDSWVIKNIHLFPKNSVKIINRWGDVVFSAQNYQNNWRGSFGDGLLPAGTYYYILDVGGSLGVLKGDLTILRE